jgi:uncharacterized protein (TIGR03437 family)
MFYITNISAEGARGNVSFAITSGSLPPGLATTTQSPSDLTISGVPNVPGSYSFRLTATDSAASVSLDYVIVVANQPILLGPDALPGAAVWTEYSADLTAAGGTPPYSFGILTGYLPTGVTLSAGGGLRGRPEIAGTFGIVAQATDSQGLKGTKPFQLVVADAALVLTPFSLPPGVLRQSYSVTLGASGGTPPYSFSIVQALPAGLGLSSDGLLGGTPARAGNFTFRVNARDSKGLVGSRSYQLSVAGDAITLGPDVLPDAQTGRPYSAMLTASGGTPPYTFSMPYAYPWVAGLTVNSNGSITGTTTVSGPLTLICMVIATDANGSYGSREFQIRLLGGNLALTITPATIPAAVVGQYYDVALAAVGGTWPYSFRVASGQLPPGLTFGSQGRIFGAPSQQGAFSFLVEAADSGGGAASQSYTIQVSATTITLSPAALPQGKVGVAYTRQITASGGTPPYTFSVIAGSLPSELTLTADGMLSGAPRVEGTFNFVIRGADSGGSSGTIDYQFIVRPAGLSLFPDALPAASVGRAYSLALQAGDGAPPYQFSLASGPPAPGITLAASGLLAGTPEQAGTFVLLVRVADSVGATGARDYTLRVEEAGIVIAPAALAPAVAGQFYNVILTASGGASPYTFTSVPNSVLPLGMALSTTGVLSGIPTNAGTYRFTVEATDVKGATGTADLVFEVRQAAIRIGPDVLPFPTVGSPYSAVFTAEGGTGPYRFALSSGTLPRGLNLTSSGLLSGNLQQGGLYSFQIAATDTQGGKGQRDYELRVSPIEVLPSTLGAAVVGKGFLVVFSASGGTPPFVFSLSSGELPPGLALHGGSSLSGTPSAPGTFHFTLQARDSNGATGVRDYTFVVYPAGIVLTTESLPGGARGEEYFSLFTAQGGAPPYSFSIKTGALPAGLRLETSGILSGAPAAAGTYAFTVEARDTGGNAGSRQYTLTVGSDPPLTVLTTWLAKATAQVDYRAMFEASGGRPPYRWEIVSGFLPAGVQLSAEGSLDGTPAESGQFLFSVIVRDAAERTSQQVLALVVTAGPDSSNTLFFDPPVLSLSARESGLDGGETRCVAVFSTKAAAGFTASLYTPPVAWASLDSNTLRTPGSVCVNVQRAGLAAGTYRGELRLTSSEVLPASISIPLVLTVEPDTPPLLRVTPKQLQVSSVRGGPASVQSVWVINEGSGSLSYTVEAPASPWLTVETTSGTASNGEPSAISMRVSPAGLAAGIYVASFSLRSGQRAEDVRVELVVSEGGGQISLSQTALELVAWAGGTAVSSSVGLTNEGVRTLSVAALLPDAPSTGWLKAELESAALPAGGTAPLKISADPRSLAPGRYSSRVEVRAEDGVNSPQVVTVGLTVLPADAPLPPDAPLAPVVLTPNSPSQTLAFAVPPARPLTFNSVSVGPDSGWLRITPAEGGVVAGGPLEVTVAADMAGMGAGDHQATAAIGFSDGTVRAIPVSLIVPVAVTGLAEQPLRAASSCDSDRPFVVHVLSPPSGFQVSSQRPVAVRARIQYCDGTFPVTARAMVLAAGQTLTLSPESTGIWAGTWVPANPQERVQLEVVANTDQGSATAFVEGTVTATTVREAELAAALHSATLRSEDPVVPGAWVTLFGSDLAPAPLIADSSVLPDALGGFQVLVGGLPLRLRYVGTGQVNALMPGALPPNTRQQLVLLRDGAPTVPLAVVVAEAQPGVFTMNQLGTGQATALHAGTRSLAGPLIPARRGETIEIYCTGLGPVDVSTPNGESAPLSGLARVRIPVSVTVGGRSAEVSFAGFAPGTVGLYQVNARIPDDAPAGDAVEVVLTQGSASSNIVTIAVSEGR